MKKENLEAGKEAIEVEQAAKEYATIEVPAANPNDAPYTTTGDIWDFVYDAFIAGANWNPAKQATPVKRDEDWKHHFKDWLEITLNISLPADKIIQLIIDHVDFYIKDPAIDKSNEAELK